MGKPVDLGALMLQNEQVRAVGNMNVNARGDLLDSTNRVIERKNQQVQKHYRKQSSRPKPASPAPARNNSQSEHVVDPADTFQDLEPEQDDPQHSQAQTPVKEVATDPATETRGGLAAAIARSRAVKQELEKTQRQRMQEKNLKKI